MADEKEKVEMTTVMVDVETRDLLKELAGKNERSMAAQLRFMVKQQLAALEAMSTGPAAQLATDAGTGGV
jgi:hypothetical protein